MRIPVYERQVYSKPVEYQMTNPNIPLSAFGVVNDYSAVGKALGSAAETAMKISELKSENDYSEAMNALQMKNTELMHGLNGQGGFANAEGDALFSAGADYDKAMRTFAEEQMKKYRMPPALAAKYRRQLDQIRVSGGAQLSSRAISEGRRLRDAGSDRVIQNYVLSELQKAQEVYSSGGKFDFVNYQGVLEQIGEKVKGQFFHLSGAQLEQKITEYQSGFVVNALQLCAQKDPEQAEKVVAAIASGGIQLTPESTATVISKIIPYLEDKKFERYGAEFVRQFGWETSPAALEAFLLRQGVRKVTPEMRRKFEKVVKNEISTQATMETYQERAYEKTASEIRGRLSSIDTLFESDPLAAKKALGELEAELDRKRAQNHIDEVSYNNFKRQFSGIADYSYYLSAAVLSVRSGEALKTEGLSDAARKELKSVKTFEKLSPETQDELILAMRVRDRQSGRRGTGVFDGIRDNNGGAVADQKGFDRMSEANAKAILSDSSLSPDDMLAKLMEAKMNFKISGRDFLRGKEALEKFGNATGIVVREASDRLNEWMSEGGQGEAIFRLMKGRDFEITRNGKTVKYHVSSPRDVSAYLSDQVTRYLRENSEAVLAAQNTPLTGQSMAQMKANIFALYDAFMEEEMDKALKKYYGSDQYGNIEESLMRSFVPQSEYMPEDVKGTGGPASLWPTPTDEEQKKYVNRGLSALRGAGENGEGKGRPNKLLYTLQSQEHEGKEPDRNSELEELLKNPHFITEN